MTVTRSATLNDVQSRSWTVELSMAFPYHLVSYCLMGKVRYRALETDANPTEMIGR
jgi:hypothetical protein